MFFLHLNLYTGHRKLCSLEHHVRRRVRIVPDKIRYYPEAEWSYKWYMIIQVNIVLSGTVNRNWCFDSAHEKDDHLVVKTLVAVNNSPTQDYNVHSPDKSYSTLLKYYRQPKLSLAISCTWKCLSLSAIKDINLLTDLTVSTPFAHIKTPSQKKNKSYLREKIKYNRYSLSRQLFFP